LENPETSEREQAYREATETAIKHAQRVIELEKQLSELTAKQDGSCEWVKTIEADGARYSSPCEIDLLFMYEDYVKTQFTFCPSCGKRITIKGEVK